LWLNYSGGDATWTNVGIAPQAINQGLEWRFNLNTTNTILSSGTGSALGYFGLYKTSATVNELEGYFAFKTRTNDVSLTTRLIIAGNGNINIGTATAIDTQSPDLIITGDADSDGTAFTTEALTVALTSNATPTLATWGFTSTQGAGYTFDKPVTISGNLSLPDPGTSANSYLISLKADNSTAVQEGQIQTIFGADPYVRISAPDDAGAVTATLDIHDTKLSFGTGTAGVDYSFDFNGETNDGTITYMEDEDRFDFDNDVDVIGDLTAATVQSDATVKATTMLGNVAQQTITLGAGAVTFAVTSNVITVTGNGGANTLATLTGGIVGIYTFIFVDALVTITDTDAHTANTVDLAGTATNFTSADDKVLQLGFDGTSWYQVAPASAN
jgi:hypothetical protein